MSPESHLCPHKKRSKSDTSQRREANALLRNFGITRIAQVVARQRNFVRSFATTATGVRRGGESRMRLHHKNGAGPQRHQLAAVGCVSNAATTLMRAERALAGPRLKGAQAVSLLLRSLRCGRPVTLLLRKRPKALLHATLRPIAQIGRGGVSLLPSRLGHFCFSLRQSGVCPTPTGSPNVYLGAEKLRSDRFASFYSNLTTFLRLLRGQCRLSAGSASRESGFRDL